MIKTRRAKHTKPEANAVDAFMAACPSYDEGYRDAIKAFAEDANDAAYVASSLKDAYAFYISRSSVNNASDYTKGMAAGLTARLA
jgi:hypothetical protein